jgi:predicted TIM-barrel fold metal-dependent hydrolase
MIPLLDRLAEADGIAIVHTNANSKLEATWRLAKLARLYPSIDFVSLVCWFAFEEGEEALDLAERVPNILWDLGGPITDWLPGWQRVERWISTHGADRLTFSADLTYARPGPAHRPPLLDHVLESSISDDAKAAILGANVRRVFSRFL